MQKCTLCNEDIDESLFETGEALDIDGEHWHTECYDEYFELEAV